MSDLELKEIFSRYIDEHIGEMTEDIMSLCRIPSVKGEALPGAPYGAEAREALTAASELMERYGLGVRMYDDRVVSGDINDLPRALDILAHMDVVAPGEGWTVTEPFSPVIKDGAIYGRGTSDDKGPAIAALYAMRAVRELNIPIRGCCRLVLGSDEECGSSDLPAYLTSEGEAPMTFTPDSSFPVTNVEKGQYRATVSADYDDISTSGLISMSSGDTINIAPGRAEARVKGIAKEEITAAAEALKTETGALFTAEITGDGDTDIIRLTGQATHAALPGTGVNAGVLMLHLIDKLGVGGTLGAKISALAGLFPYGDHEGRGIGADGSDEIAGATTVSPDIFLIENGSISIKLDARTSRAFSTERVRNTVEGAGLSIEGRANEAHYVPADSPFVKTLLSVYELASGRRGYTMAIGGGTYVHEFQRGVAFGAVGEGTETHMHGADEFMPIEELKQAALIYALSIAKLLG